MEGGRKGESARGGGKGREGEREAGGKEWRERVRGLAVEERREGEWCRGGGMRGTYTCIHLR